jgi:hypothetical protein
LLAGKLKRSLISVQRQLRELGICRRKDNNWTPDQAKLLRAQYATAAVWEIANATDKTPSEVKRKAKSLGLKK